MCQGLRIPICATIRSVHIALLCLMACPQDCHGALERDDSWSSTSLDGRYVFVMTPPVTLEEEIEAGNTSPSARHLRERYPESGLYETNGDQVWRTSFYGHGPGYVSNDGQHVVVLGRFIKASYPFADDDVLYCVHQGNMVSTVTYNDVSPLWWLKCIMLNQGGVRCLDHEYDPIKNIIAIRTNLWEVIELDFDTGKVIEFRDPIGKSIGLATIAVLLGIPIIWLTISKRSRARREADGTGTRQD